jgi:pimeloyl-ACP methyl ester carboxylesterase
MTSSLVRVNDTRLFIDDRGDATAPPLLFIHGGPGQSCYDFMQVQGDRLARRLRIIGVDQRGTLRSDPLPAEPALTPELLISDFEALRKHLEIASWAILGHSDGGGYALQYVTSHPKTVQAVIFDCPCWDADLTDRNRLPQVARKLEALGQQADAERCRQLAAKPSRLTAADETYLAAQALGPHHMELYFHDPVVPLTSARSWTSRGSPRSNGSAAARILRCCPVCMRRGCRCSMTSPGRPCCYAARTIWSPRRRCWRSSGSLRQATPSALLTDPVTSPTSRRQPSTARPLPTLSCRTLADRRH